MLFKVSSARLFLRVSEIVVADPLHLLSSLHDSINEVGIQICFMSRFITDLLLVRSFQKVPSTLQLGLSLRSHPSSHLPRLLSGRIDPRHSRSYRIRFQEAV